MAPAKGIAEIKRVSRLDKFASVVTGVSEARLPTSDYELRGVLVAEAIRTGLSTLASPQEPSVHPLRLRRWVVRKIGILIPEAIEGGRQDFRSVLAGDRIGNMEFMGDVEILPGGYLRPAASRVVETGQYSFLLVSGAPTFGLKALRENLRLTGMGRRIEGLNVSQLAAIGYRVQSAEAYVSMASFWESPDALLSRIAKRPGAAGPAPDSWEIYVGRKPGEFGFAWAKPSSSTRQTASFRTPEGHRLSLWREPTSERYWKHWLVRGDGVGPEKWEIPGQDWKRACLAADLQRGKPRVALLTPGDDPMTSHLVLDFPPYEGLLRWICAGGGKYFGRYGASDAWLILDESIPTTEEILSKAGVEVRTGMKGERL